MKILLFILATVLLVMYFDRYAKKSKKKHGRDIALWYLKGVVYEGGSVTHVLEYDLILNNAMERGHVREGIDTDKGGKFLLKCRIELVQELVKKASIYLSKGGNEKETNPSPAQIDQILLEWLGPTKTKLSQEISGALAKSDASYMTEEWMLQNLGDMGKKLYEHYLEQQLNKMNTGAVGEEEYNTNMSLMFGRIKAFNQLKTELQGGRNNDERKMLNRSFLELAKGCGIEIGDY